MIRGGSEDAGQVGLLKGLKLSEEEQAGVKGAWKKEAREIGKVPQAVGKLFS